MPFHKITRAAYLLLLCLFDYVPIYELRFAGQCIHCQFACTPPLEITTAIIAEKNYFCNPRALEEVLCLVI